MRSIILSTLFGVISILGYAQKDTTSNKYNNKLSFNISGVGYYQGLRSRSILLPESVIANRRNHHTEGLYWVSDNPMFHGPLLTSANIHLSIVKGLDLFSSFVAEHRGFSYGVYDSKSMIVYPRINVVINQNIVKFGKHFLKLKINVGNKTNAKVQEGLTIYNLDGQGWNVAFAWNKLQLELFHLGDLGNWIGLNINDSFDYFLKYRDIKLSENWKLDVHAGYSNYFRIESPYILTSSIGVGNKIHRFYCQIGKRQLTTGEDGRNLAILGGYSHKIVKKKITVNSKVEIRYYQSRFNEDFVDYRVKYRDTTANINYRNTIGNNLYPLSLYDRPFSQWAVYTEYQNKDVVSIALFSELNYEIYQSIRFIAKIDLNAIQARGEDLFLYPFVTIGGAWQPIKGNLILVGISNKGMNLDASYPTHSLFEKYGFFAQFKRELGNWKKEKTKDVGMLLNRY